MKTDLVAITVVGVPAIPGQRTEDVLGTALTRVDGVRLACPVQLLVNAVEPTHRVYGAFVRDQTGCARPYVLALRDTVPDDLNTGSFRVEVAHGDVCDEAEDGYAV